MNESSLLLFQSTGISYSSNVLRESDFISLGMLLTDFNQSYLRSNFPQMKKILTMESLAAMNTNVLEKVFAPRRITECKELNYKTFRITADGTVFVSKFIDADSHEAQICRLLTGYINKNNQLNFILPLETELSNNQVLTWQCINGKIDESKMFEQSFSQLAELMDKVISVLVKLQTSVKVDCDLYSKEIMSSDYFINLKAQSFEGLPGFNARKFVRHYQQISMQLKKMSQLPRNVFVHGDFKLDNVLYDEQKDSMVIIDWEKAGLGPCEVDIGNFFGALFSSWLSYKVNMFDGDFSKILTLGKWSPNQFFALIQRMWRQFEGSNRTQGLEVNSELCWQFAGTFLMHRAWVSNMYGGRFNLSSKMCFDMGFDMVRNPTKFSHQLEQVHESSN